MKGWTMKAIIKGSPIFYEQIGEGIPVLCLHGFPEDHRSVAFCLEPVLDGAEGFCRIYLDLPGMGKSPVNPNIKNADDMLEAICEFIDLVIGKVQFLLFGQSYGGYLSLGLISHRSEMIKGVFLLCPCVVADRSKRILPDNAEQNKPALAFAPSVSKEDFDDFLSMTSVVNEATWERYKKEILPGLLCADQTFTEAYQGAGYSFSFDPGLQSVSFESPVAILAGRQDYCVGYEDAYQLSKKFRRASFYLADEAGHNLQIEQPRIFEGYLKHWYASFLE